MSFSCLLWLSISIHAPPRGATLVFWTVSSTTIFQFTPLREGRRQRNGAAAGRRIFQFTPLREGRHGDTPRHCIRFQFQFTPLREGRPSPDNTRPASTAFQFTPLREGRHKVDSAYVYTIEFQFTPLREGRREVGGISNMRRISIHAPPRGATRFAAGSEFPPVYFNSRPSARSDHRKDGKRMKIAISIHAPPRGATRSVAIFSTSSEFQFTPLREGRRGSVRHAAGAAAISIHAPPRGATLRRI